MYLWKHKSIPLSKIDANMNEGSFLSYKLKPEVKQTHEQNTNTPVNATYEPTEPHPEPVPRKIRKSGTGCVYQINDHLWEGSFYPRLPTGKRKKFNVYAESRDQCETKLAEMIAEKKAEIAEEKAKLKEGAD